MPSPVDREPIDLDDEDLELLARFSELDTIRAQQEANKRTRRNLLALGFVLLSLQRIRPGPVATPTGKPLPVLSPRQVRTTLDKFIDSTTWDMSALAESYRTGGLTLAEWQAQMLARVKSTHYGAASLQRGGYANMRPADMAEVERIILHEYRYLSRFGRDVKKGLPLDGRFVRRAEMYGKAGRGTFYEFMSADMSRAGYTEEANVIRPGDNCGGCIEQTARGWVALGQLVPIGNRTCLSNCRCALQYRNVLGDVVQG